MAFSYRDAAGTGFQAACQASIEDLFSKYKCKQTFGLLFLDKKKAELADMPAVIQMLQLDSADIIGVQRDTEKWWSRLLVKLDDDALMEFERMKDMDGEIITLRRNNCDVKIMIQDMTSNIKYVAVSGIPFEVPNEAVAALMSRFGDVKGIRMNYYKSILNGIATGTRIIKMNIKRSIPSVIKVGSKTLNIAHEGQIKTCYKCGMEDHLGDKCETKDEEKIHRINDTDYPLLNSQQSASKETPVAEPEATPVGIAAALPHAPAAEATAAAAAAAVAAAAASAVLATKPAVAKVSTDPAQDKQDKTIIAPVSKPVETDIPIKEKDTVTLPKDSMIKDQANLLQMDTEQQENEKSLVSPNKESQPVFNSLENITSPIMISKARNCSKDKMTYEEVGIKNLTLNSPVPQCEMIGNIQLLSKSESPENKQENGNLKETSSPVKYSPQDAEINDSKGHFTLDEKGKNVDSSCDSQMIPCNQLGFLSPSGSNKRCNVDNMTESDRNVKGKFGDV